MKSERGAATVAAPFIPDFRRFSADRNRLLTVPPRWRHRIFWGFAAGSSVSGRGDAHGPGVGEHRPRITVVPRWHHHLFWSCTESSRIRSLMQRAASSQLPSIVRRGSRVRNRSIRESGTFMGNGVRRGRAPDPDERRLAAWAAKQRYAAKRGRLFETRIDRLNNLSIRILPTRRSRFSD